MEFDDTIGRRELLASIATATAGLAACAIPVRKPTDTAPAIPSTGAKMTATALAGQHTLVPLPFKPSALRGLSERLTGSHHENNYGGAVKNLNRTEQELARVAADTPPLVVAALRERELTFRNSKSLHEAYFGNLGGDGKRTGPIEAAIAAAYGSTAAWEAQLRATALGLGGGSGWAILACELDTGALRTHWSGNHTQALATSVPLLVLDMYEHSYALDYGAAHSKYIDAFFENVNWDEVNRRLERAQRASAVLRGA